MHESPAKRDEASGLLFIMGAIGLMFGAMFVEVP